MSDLRNAVERRSRPILLILSRQPRALVPLIAVALFGGLLLLPAAPAIACLAVLLVFVSWLGYLAWPALGTGGKVVRVATVLVLVALGVRAVRG